MAKQSRHIEIDPEVDFDSRRAVYFRQMRYGLFVRISIDLLRAEINRFIDSHGSTRQHHGIKLLSIGNTVCGFLESVT